MDRRALLALLLAAPALLVALPGGAAQPAGLELREIDLGESPSGYPGEKHTYGFEIVNHAGEEVTAHIGLNESTGTLYLSQDAFGYSSIPAFGTLRFNVTVYVDPSTPAGTYTLRVDATPSASSVPGASHQWYFDVQPSPPWDLAVSGSRPIPPGSSTTIGATITNSADAPYDYVLAATALDGDLALAWDAPTLRVRGGESGTATLTVEAPSDTPDGQYAIQISVYRSDEPEAVRSVLSRVWVDRSWYPPPAPPTPTVMPVPPAPARPVESENSTGAVSGEPTSMSVRVVPPASVAPGTKADVQVTVFPDTVSSGAVAYRASERTGRLDFAESTSGVLSILAGVPTTFSLMVPANAAPDTYQIDLRFWWEPNASITADDAIQLLVEKTAPPPMLAKDLDARFEPQPLRVAPGTSREAQLVLRHDRAATLTVRLIESGAAWRAAAASAPAVEYPRAPIDVPGGETTSVPVAVRAPEGASGEHRYELQVEVTQEGARVLREYVTLTVLVGAPPATPLRAMSDFVKAHPVSSASGFVLGGFALVSIPFWRREWWRYGAMLPLLPLYTRLQKREVLDHKTRERIHQMIVEQPGIHYSALKEATGLNAGALVHHLRTLERHGLVASRREGVLRRFFPVGARLPPPPEVVLTPTQGRILELLDAQPMTQRELADRLGITQQGVSYHLKTLERKGQLLLERDGGEWRYYRVRDLAGQPVEPAAT